jgi:hypothetical protein
VEAQTGKLNMVHRDQLSVFQGCSELRLVATPSLDRNQLKNQRQAKIVSHLVV